MTKDSFEALEEILEIGERHQVDLGLQSGDLYHDLYPSHECICKTLRIFEKFVFGSRSHRFRVELSAEDSSANYNFLSEEKKVKLPIIGIHGNHDYPMQMSRDSAYEMLSITKNITYIGKTDQLGRLRLKPVVLVSTVSNVVLAVYGIGYVKDSLLIPILEKKNYDIELIPEHLRTSHKCIRVLLFHQNRFKVFLAHTGRCHGSAQQREVQYLAPRLRPGHLGTRA